MYLVTDPTTHPARPLQHKNKMENQNKQWPPQALKNSPVAMHTMTRVTKRPKLCYISEIRVKEFKRPANIKFHFAFWSRMLGPFCKQRLETFEMTLLGYFSNFQQS